MIYYPDDQFFKMLISSPHYAYQHLSESRRVLSHVSGTLDDDIFVQRMVGSVHISSVRVGMVPARLTRTFGAGCRRRNRYMR